MEKNIPEGTKFNGVIGGTFTWSNGGVGIEDTIRRIVREEIAAHEERLKNQEFRIDGSVVNEAAKIAILKTPKMTFNDVLDERVINAQIED